MCVCKGSTGEGTRDPVSYPRQLPHVAAGSCGNWLERWFCLPIGLSAIAFSSLESFRTPLSQIRCSAGGAVHLTGFPATPPRQAAARRPLSWVGWFDGALCFTPSARPACSVPPRNRYGQRVSPRPSASPSRDGLVPGASAWASRATRRDPRSFVCILEVCGNLHDGFGSAPRHRHLVAGIILMV